MSLSFVSFDKIWVDWKYTTEFTRLITILNTIIPPPKNIFRNVLKFFLIIYSTHQQKKGYFFF